MVMRRPQHSNRPPEAGQPSGSTMGSWGGTPLCRAWLPKLSLPVEEAAGSIRTAHTGYVEPACYASLKVGGHYWGCDSQGESQAALQDCILHVDARGR